MQGRATSDRQQQLGSAWGFQCDWRLSQASAGGSAAATKLIGSQACWPPPAHPPPRSSRSPTALVHPPSREALWSSGGHTRVRPAENRPRPGTGTGRSLGSRWALRAGLRRPLELPPAAPWVCKPGFFTP